MSDHKKIEKKWQKFWEEKNIAAPDLDRAKKPFYNLTMFPYPSAEGLHIGNVYDMVGADIYGRFKKLLGFDVFQPMGYDAFGIHSENYALKLNKQPKKVVAQNIKNFRKQINSLGTIFDFSHTVDTTKPDYYKWTQWIFLRLFKKGLAHRAKAPVNWCPSCKTVLADEQAEGGVCERCKTEVVQKELDQWFLRITEYAERLLKNLDALDWSESIKTAQRNWIGKSEGAVIKFSISNSQFSIGVFTTRLDTIFGATYLVLAPEHTTIKNLKFKIKNFKEVENYIIAAQRKTGEERMISKDKTGVELKGIKAMNPATNEEIPVLVADYVIGRYGTGAIMAVPAHDERDWEFAKKHNLPVKRVVQDMSEEIKNFNSKFKNNPESVFEGAGILIDSDQFTGLDSEKAKGEITAWFAEKGIAKKTVNYKLRDWTISRQRYWGPPIPIIYCRKCLEIPNSKIQITNKFQNPNSPDASRRSGRDGLVGAGKLQTTVIDGVKYAVVPVLEEDLPVALPPVKDFRPTGTGVSPLAKNKGFVKAKCPQCGGEARRETDVSDNFLDSAWYFLRYPSTDFSDRPFDQNRTKNWLPPDMYRGGPEHAVLHMMYARFINMALYDMKFLPFEEPFPRFRVHGLITRGGAKMSKSRGNVVVPDEYVKKYGADAMRMHLMFLGPYEAGGDFNDKNIAGVERFLGRAKELVKLKIKNLKLKISIQNSEINDGYAVDRGELEKILHKTIKKVGERLETMQFNTAVAALMELLNAMNARREAVSKKDLEIFTLLIAPFAPHTAEELWEKLGNRPSVFFQRWPAHEEAKIKEEEIDIIIQINGKVRDKIMIGSGISDKEIEKLALQREKIAGFLNGRAPKRVIVVSGRLVNIVV